MKTLAFIKSQPNKTYVCRQAYTTAELRLLLQLRYRIMRAAYGTLLVGENAAELDLDAFDAHSIHIGVFEYDGAMHRAVGYMRLITESETAFAPMIREIIDAHPALSASGGTPQYPFPLFKFFDAKDTALMTSAWRGNGQGTLMETGRFCLDESLQKSGAARFAVESMISISIEYFGDNGTVMIIVAPNHVGFYEKYGFMPTLQLLVPERFMVLTVKMSDIAQRFGKEIAPKRRPILVNDNRRLWVVKRASTAA
jgi:predicted GNAT family N-acyltransferase